ncbi:tape measure protein [Pseudaminobacter sp. 19-2017]|uniref:Tape measure protein n=1 Tax=Pseudaminobacter soli (ex Zhang et al. 2022) TaxID=2831468 RepID=A0A942DY13_9HYPH|nr:tape measure protein [Pseudaminobacter soli]MBS3649666.1 tape measure protein [Pseudaminobacter soli]
MASDVERLIVSLEAKTKAFENSLNKANATAQKRLRDIERQFERTNKKAVLQAPRGSMMAGLGGVRGMVGGFAAAAGVHTVRQYADAWTEAGNKIAAASQVSGKQARSLRELNDIATATRTGITETTDLYAKLLRSTKDVAKSEEEVAQATEIVNKAFKAGGAAASEQAAGILQLSQGLGSGILQGDELRSVRENAPLLAQAIADEFKTTIAGLKELGANGELEVGRVFKAILKAKPKIDKAFAATTATIADGIDLLRNSAIEAIGRINTVTGASGKAGERLAQFANIIETVAGAIEGVAGSPTGKFLGFLTEMVSKLEPINRALDALQNVDKLGEGIAGFAGKIADAELNDIEDATRALTEFFKARRQGAKEGFISPEQLRRFDELEKKISSAGISAGEAKEEVRAIVALDEGTSPQIVELFDIMIDKLDLIAKRAKAAKSATLGIFDDERGAMLASRRKDEAYAGFIDERTADAKRTEIERQIDTRTDAILKAAEDVGVAITEAAARIQAEKELGIEGAVKSREGSISKYVDQVVSAESGGNANAKNPRSSATGLGQFIESTWLTLFRKHFPREAEGMSRSAILALRTDGVKSKALIEAYARENAAVLQQAGVSVNEVALHLAHFLGPGGAAAVLKAAPGTPVSQVLSAGAIKANPEVLGGGKTVDDVIGYGERRAGMKTTRTQTLDSRESFQENLDAYRQQLEFLKEETGLRQSLNPLVDDYGRGLTTLRAAQELLSMAQQEGTAAGNELSSTQQLLYGDLSKLSPEARAQAEAMRTLALASGEAEAASNQLSVAQDNLADRMAAASSFGKDILGGFIRDLREGKSASEALANAVGKIADRLLDLSLDILFDGFGGKAGSGILGSLFSSFFPFADGGIAKNGKPVPLKRFARGGVSKTAAIFGEAGAEAAVPLPDGRRIPVDLRIPQFPKVQRVAAAAAPAPNVDARTKVINAFDAGSFLSEALSSTEGEKVILNFVRARPAAFKAAMQG